MPAWGTVLDCDHGHRLYNDDTHTLWTCRWREIKEITRMLSRHKFDKNALANNFYLQDSQYHQIPMLSDMYMKLYQRTVQFVHHKYTMMI